MTAGSSGLQPSEQSREHAYRQEEVWPASNPALTILRDTATRNDAVDVRVMIEVLAPGVQDGCHTDVGAEVLGIGADRAEGVGGGREQHSVDLGLVLIGNGSDRRRQSEHHMEIGDW